MTETHLITGGAGYLGVRLAQRLIDAGHPVVCFDRVVGARPASATWIAGDVRDAGALVAAARGCAVIHHLVGIMPQARAGAATMQAVNVDGTRNALEAARAHRCRRLVFASSSEVYGVPRSVPISEDHPRQPIGEYGRTKVAAEDLCRAYARGGEIETVIIRPSTLVGEGIGERLFLTFLDRATRGRPLAYPWPGTNRFQMTAVRDCVEAFVRAAAAPNVNGAAFNVGAPDTLPLRAQLAALRRRAGIRSRIYPLPAGLTRAALRLLDTVGRSPLERDHYLLMDRDIVMDCAKAERLLGLQPQQTNVDMILEALAWYRNRPAADAPWGQGGEA